MKEKIYVGLVGQRKIEGKTKQDFVINYLTELFEQNKELDSTDRMQAYVNYFVENFSYDNDLRERVIAEDGLDTYEKTEDNLFCLLYEGKGVCQQLAQALSIVTHIDYLKTKKAIPLYYVATDIKLNGKDLAHAFNVIKKEDSVWFVIDISSMIHSKEGDYKQSKECFYLKSSEQYCQNMKKEGVEILTLIKEGKVCAFPFVAETEEYYKLINEDKEVLKKYSGVWLDFDRGEDIENGI